MLPNGFVWYFWHHGDRLKQVSESSTHSIMRATDCVKKTQSTEWRRQQGLPLITDRKWPSTFTPSERLEWLWEAEWPPAVGLSLTNTFLLPKWGFNANDMTIRATARNMQNTQYALHRVIDWQHQKWNIHTTFMTPFLSTLVWSQSC